MEKKELATSDEEENVETWLGKLVQVEKDDTDMYVDTGILDEEPNETEKGDGTLLAPPPVSSPGTTFVKQITCAANPPWQSRWQ